MLSTKLSSFKSSNPKQIPSQRTKRNEFWCPRTLRSRAFFCLASFLLFLLNFHFQPTQNAEFWFFVRCPLVAQRRLNKRIRGREEHHSSCLCLATNAQQTALRDFPFCSFVTCLACPMLFFIIPCFL